MAMHLINFCQQWLPLPLFSAYRVLISLYVLAWLFAAGVEYNNGGYFFTYLTFLSYILLTAGFLLRAAISVVYTACYYGGSKILEWLFPPSINRVYSQDNTRWYLKISWFIHTTSTVLAVGVAIGYWAFLCSGSKSSSNSSLNITAMFNTTNLTQAAACPRTVINLHVHGINAAIAFLDIWMSRVPFQLYHFFYTSILTVVYLIFTLIYWGAHHRTNSGVIYSILDYGNNTYAGLFAVVLILLPILIHLALFGIFVVRDMMFEALRKLFSRTVLVREKRRSDAGACTKVMEMNA